MVLYTNWQKGWHTTDIRVILCLKCGSCNKQIAYRFSVFVKFFLFSFVFFSVQNDALRLTSHDILHFLWSANLSKSFSQLIASILSFLNIFFNRFYPVEKYPTLLISCFINFKVSSFRVLLLKYFFHFFIFLGLI